MACGQWNAADEQVLQPSRLPVGPLVVGVWLPAGLDALRFAPDDQARLEALGINFLEWLQRAEAGGATAEQLAMEFCGRSGMRMPVYYEPPGYSPYDKLHNWTARADRGPGFEEAVQERVRALQRQWNGQPGFAGYLVGHEDYDRDYYPALERAIAVLRREDAQRPAFVVGRIDHYPAADRFLDALFPEGTPANVFQHEHYVFREGVPTAGAGLQRRLDELVASYGRASRLLRSRSGRWHAIVQVHGETRDGASFYRPPTPAEIRVQAGLALSRGAAGVICFLYSSGVEEVRDQDGQVRQRRVYSGLVNEQGQLTERYWAVQELSRQLRILSPVLENLRFHGGFAGAQPPDNPLVCQAEADLEFGVFGDGVQATHLLVVNRATHQARQVRLGVRRPHVADAASAEVLAVQDGEIVAYLEPGGFRILEMHGKEGGTWAGCRTR